MTATDTPLAQEVKAFCAHIGAQPLLVQGAGGNVSWKEGGTLWVKASGTWLAQALTQDIFVPVDLDALRTEIARSNFNATPQVTGNSTLRPSIETMLHALMPHRVVVHVHAIEALAHLVRQTAPGELAALIGPDINWIEVPYLKPGGELASAIHAGLSENPNASVALLRNHGVVIGGDSVTEVDRTLQLLNQRLQTAAIVHMPPGPSPASRELAKQGYHPVSNPTFNQFVFHANWLARIRKDWALYPDHVVFLGPQAQVLLDDERAHPMPDGKLPPFVFVEEQGCYELDTVTAAQRAQLQCYADVLARQAEGQALSPLKQQDIAALLNWDAEKYRQSLSRT